MLVDNNSRENKTKQNKES